MFSIGLSLSFRSIFRASGLVFFTTLLLVYYFYFGTWDLSAVKAISYKIFFVLALIHVVSLLSHALAVWLLVRRIEASSSFVSAYLSLTAASVISYLVPGRLGFPVRVYLYHSLFGVTVAVAFGLLGWELAITTVLPVIFSIPALWIFYSELWSFAVLLFLMSFALVLVSAGYYLSQDEKKPTRLAKIQRIIRRVLPFTDGMGQALKSVDIRTLAAFSLLCLLVLICSTLFSHVILVELGTPVSFFRLLSIQSLSYLVGLISLMPMGLGARELSLAVLLGEVGVPVDLATYAAIIQRLVGTGISFLLGVISWQVLALKGNVFESKEGQKAYEQGK